jgi:hypothetical protein
MFKRVLFPTDFSVYANAVFACLPELKAAGMRKVVLLGVVHPPDFSDCANAAFQVVKRLKSAGTQEVILLHVQDERAMRNRPAEQIAAFDEEDTRRLNECGMTSC